MSIVFQDHDSTSIRRAEAIVAAVPQIFNGPTVIEPDTKLRIFSALLESPLLCKDLGCGKEGRQVHRLWYNTACGGR